MTLTCTIAMSTKDQWTITPLKADCDYGVPLVHSLDVSDIEVICGQTVDGVLFEIVGLVETKK